MRLLLLNPNTSATLTDRMVAQARAFAGAETTIVGKTAERGVPYISSRPEAVIAAAWVLETIATNERDCDGVVIAAFGDPGLTAARDLFPVPITAMADAALATAGAIGQRVSLITFSRALIAWFEDSVRRSGLGARSGRIKLLREPYTSLETAAEELEDAIVSAVREAASLDGADVAILAGAPLAGAAQRLSAQFPIPTVDPLAAAVLQAETLVRLGLLRRIGQNRLPAKDSKGLPQALADRIAHSD